MTAKHPVKAKKGSPVKCPPLDKETAQQIQILRYWHAVEFFSPFNLDDILIRKPYFIYFSQLAASKDAMLPWVNKQAIQLAGGDPTKKYRYNIYLLPFNKNELTRLCERVFNAPQNDIQRVAFEEQLSDEGMTCFARLSLNETGQLNAGRFSVSTLPWAMGKLKNKALHELSFKSYQDELSKLKEVTRLIHDRLEENNENSYRATPLITSALLELIDFFKKWADFQPTSDLAAVVELKPIIEKKKKALPNKEDKKSLTSNSVAPSDEETPSEKTQENTLSDNDVNESESKKNEKFSVDILNSFYIEDLERVINQIANQSKHAALKDYLLGKNQNEKIDLYGNNSRQFVAETVSLQKMNRGRWPSENRHIMSLMQQFAVNHFLSKKPHVSLSAVNGPPGTGKTTLLQDIIADNITSRAAVLAKFKKPSEAFKDRLCINFASGETRHIGVLKDSLTGYEMLVVSSNNTAVENISKDLPQKKKLGESYQNFCEYLSPISAMAAAAREDEKICPLVEKPWGLVAATLGNSSNCYQFRSRVFFSPEAPEKRMPRLRQGEYLTIWEWRKQYKGPTFPEAQTAFLDVEKKLNDSLNDLKTLEKLHFSIAKMTEAQYCLGEFDALSTQHEILAALSQHEKEAADKQQSLETRLKNMREHFQTLGINKPNLFEKVIRSERAVQYNQQLAILKKQFIELIQQEKINHDELEDLKQKRKTDEKILKTLNEIYENKKIEFQNYYRQYTTLRSKHREAALPPNEDAESNGNDKSVQMKTFWQTEQLNALRSELFIKALELHQAWLAAVMKDGSFRDNLLAVSTLLARKQLSDPQAEIHLWQSLFMWVPVISSTFASMSRLFRHIGKEQFGFLLIDEAGQALPQSAAGAIWRCKNTLAVGDPFQIEPVFTTPPTLTEKLGKHYLGKGCEKWLPFTASVQKLADSASQFGALIAVENTRERIGIPLRIHRRCLDPMFSLANQIAYNKKMINARTETPSENGDYPLGESCWFHVAGETTDRQYVQAQGDFLVQLFTKLYEQEAGLPNVFVITPFKRIKSLLKKCIANPKNWASMLTYPMKLPKTETLSIWCQQHIGTIHTFQGKEADSVILVLGADKNHQGSANWAADKPNLLNVALTRARNRFYVIGDYTLWQTKNYFKQLASQLEIINIE